jgi:quinol monooxygenase YgiN
MASVVATIKVKEDKLEGAKAFFEKLAAEVTANEPGTLAYVFHQRRDDPLTFVVYEKYESDEAFALHSRNLAAKGADFKALLSGPPDIILLEEI